MKRRTWCVALGLWLLAAPSLSAQIVQGVMAIKGAEMP